MKFSATVSLLATLAAQAYCQGVVTIQAKGQKLVLTDQEEPGLPLTFSENTGDQIQKWHEIRLQGPETQYQNVVTGRFINCEVKEDGTCISDHSPQPLNKFEEGPDSFFSVNGFSEILQRTNSQLQLAPPPSDYLRDEQLFTLRPASQCE